MFSDNTKKIATVVTCIFSIVFIPSAIADWLYLVERGNSGSEDTLIRVDPDSQQPEIIGPLGFNYRFGSMVWHPDREQLLVVNSRPRETSNDPTLTDFYWVNPSTAASEHIGSLNLGVQSSLVGYGITIDDKGSVLISFTDLETYEAQIFNVTLEPLGAALALSLGISNNELDNLEYDPNTGDFLTLPPSVNQNPASVYAIDLQTGVDSLKCSVQLPANFDEDPERGINNAGLSYDASRGSFWVSTLGHPLVQMNLGSECTSSPIDQNATTFNSDAIAYVPIDPPGFVLNPGLNDAWYNPTTVGQGFLTTIFPNIQQMFVAWFTYDTARPPEGVEAMIGEPGHRWLTAQGPYEGNTASLTIYVTQGGVFDAAEPPASNDGIGDGTMTIEFTNCEGGLVTYEIFSPGVSGEIPIQRVVDDNVALCEALSNQ